MWECVKCLTKAIAADLLQCPHCYHGRHEQGSEPEPVSEPVPAPLEPVADDTPEVPADAPQPAQPLPPAPELKEA